jgi:hypothetical protein
MAVIPTTWEVEVGEPRSKATLGQTTTTQHSLRKTLKKKKNRKERRKEGRRKGRNKGRKERKRKEITSKICLFIFFFWC